MNTLPLTVLNQVSNPVLTWVYVPGPQLGVFTRSSTRYFEPGPQRNCFQVSTRISGFNILTSLQPSSSVLVLVDLVRGS
jgi:hypothetical protein